MALLSNVIEYCYHRCSIVMMFGKILDTASKLKAKIGRDELQKALQQATNDDNWQASTTVLHQIASSAYSHDKWKRISEFLWDKLKGSSRWKKILKALNIVEFLIKNGPAFAADQLRRDLHFFRTMESYQAYEEGSDRGAPIRERAKAIVGLLTNEDLLEDERNKAQQIRQRMSHLPGGNYSVGPAAEGTGPKYESYNSETFGRGDSNNKEFYNYGHGNYGDRDYDRNHRDDYYQNTRKNQPTHKPQPPRETKKVEQKKPIQPIVNISKGRKEEKGNYETMAQRLMKVKPAKSESAATRTESAPVVPDLSHKKKDVDDLLIDTEAQFIESRYHFQPPNNQKQQNKYTPPPQQTIVNQTYTPPTVTTPAPVSSPVPNLLTDMDGLLFLGIQPQQPTAKVESTPITPPVQQTSLVQQTQRVAQSYPSAAIAPPSQTLSQQAVNPAQQLSNYSQIAANHPYSAPSALYNYGYAGGYTPNAYNYHSVAPMSAPISYPNTYPPPPFYHQQQQYYPYQQPNHYNSYQNTYPIPSYPTNNVPTSLTLTTPIQTKPKYSPPQPNQTNKTEQDFGQFKNGGSFDIQKINWMSSKQKNLTDLTDFTIDPKDRQPKAQKKRDFGNNIKIDPWAW